MIDIFNIVPFNTDRCSIELLNYDDVDWYSQEALKPYFSEYLEYKSNGISLGALRWHLNNTVGLYKDNKANNFSVRFVVKIDKNRVGGATIQKYKEPGVYELGYWVTSEYQGIGIGYEILNGMTNNILTNIQELSKLVLKIRQKNLKSIRIAEKCGYKLVKSYELKGDTTLVYEYTKV